MTRGLSHCQNFSPLPQNERCPGSQSMPTVMKPSASAGM